MAEDTYIIDIKNFIVTPTVAAWAAQYLINNRPKQLWVRVDDDEVWYIGWGGRSVVRLADREYQLKSFRRFEYTTFEFLRHQPVDIGGVFADFKRRAVRNKTLFNEKGEGNE